MYYLVMWVLRLGINGTALSRLLGAAFSSSVTLAVGSVLVNVLYSMLFVITLY